jgi:hypothetical protein
MPSIKITKFQVNGVDTDPSQLKPQFKVFGTLTAAGNQVTAYLDPVPSGVTGNRPGAVTADGSGNWSCAFNLQGVTAAFNSKCYATYSGKDGDAQDSRDVTINP